MVLVKTIMLVWDWNVNDGFILGDADISVFFYLEGESRKLNFIKLIYRLALCPK